MGTGSELVMETGVNDAVYNNMFQVSSRDAILLDDEQGAVVGYNSIYNSSLSNPTGIQVVNDNFGQGANVQIVGNLVVRPIERKRERPGS